MHVLAMESTPLQQSTISKDDDVNEIFVDDSNQSIDLSDGKMNSNTIYYESFSSLESDTSLYDEVAEYDSGKKEISIEVPQGRHLGLFSTMVLFICRMVGSGIFATPSSIFVYCGGNATIFIGVWVIAALVALAGFYLFLEFGSSLPRSGGRKNFLEQAYKKPKMMMSVSFGLFSVLTGFAMSNSIIFGKYFLAVLNVQDSDLSRYISITLIVIVVLIHGFSVKNGVKIQNFLGGLKFILIFLICVTGIYSLFFYESADDNNILLWYDFQPTSIVTSSSIASAFINAFFCFSGWDSVHAVTSEIKNPTKTLKLAGPLSLLICFICYLMMNLAYLKVLTYEEIREAGPLVGLALFKKLFGNNIGGKLISISIVLSSVSNIFIVLYGISRMNQEIFREGILPFSNLLVKNWPKDAPFPSLIICGGITISWLLLLPPGGKAFDYLVNMEGYGNQFFLLLIAVGVFLFRRDQINSKESIQCPNFGVITIIIVSLYLLIGPFIGDQTQNSVKNFPPYQISAILLIFSGFFYWFTVFFLYPKLNGFELHPKLVTQEDGLIITKWIKKYN